MKIQYLGTAAAEGWPGIFCNCDFCKRAKENGGKDIRTRSQSIIDDLILMDFPQDSYSHMKDYKVDLPNIHSILITHTHQDHFYLEDLGLRSDGFSQRINGELTLYGNKAMISKFKAMYQTNTNHKHLKGKLRAKYLPPYQESIIEGYTVTPLLANHDKNEDCYIYIIEKNDKAILYANDTGYFLKETWEYLKTKHFDIVSLECTHQKYSESNNHLGLENVVQIKKEFINLGIASAQTKFVVTHFSHNGHMLHNELCSACAKHQILAAYDGLVVVHISVCDKEAGKL